MDPQPTPDNLPSRTWTRRRFLRTGVIAASGVAIAGMAGVLLGRTASPSSPTTAAAGSALPSNGLDVGASASPSGSAAAAAPAPRRSYRSRPDLSAPVIDIATAAHATAPGAIFFTPNNGQPPDGLLIVDDAGEPIWIHPDTGKPDPSLRVAGLRVSQLAGRDVLTWWEGAVNGGLGSGEYVIADQTYREIARVQAGSGLRGDLHEFILSPDGTAYLLTGRQVAATTPGSPPPWQLWDGIIQQVDLASGRVLFEWHCVDHVDVAESMIDPPKDGGSLYDYVHLNSIEIDTDGNLLVSARNTSTIYKIERATGNVRWRLGGRRSDFQMGQGASFGWQHDARRHPDGSITIFDDEMPPTPSRGIVLAVDESAMEATLVREIHHPRALAAASQGNVQVLPDGDAFIGWGSEGAYSEFGADGGIRLDASFSGSKQSYRCLRFPWVGRPTDVPAIVASRGSQASVACSWNGATEVASWEVLAGATKTGLRRVAAASRAGFETVVAVSDQGPWFAVRALDSSGQVLGTSATVGASD